MSGPTVVQAAEATTISNGAATPTFGSNVTAGNTLVAMSFGTTANMQAFPTTGQNSWTRVAGFQDSGTFDFTVEIWTRTATGGDGKTPPTINSNYNSDRNYVAMWEIDPAAVDATHMGEVPGAGGTSTNLTTGANNTLVLGACAAKFAYSAISGGGWTNDKTGPYMVHQASATSGSTYSLTIASSGGGGDTTYGMISLTSASVPSTETGAVTMALAGVGFNTQEARTETATATLALGGVKFTEAGTVSKVRHATLALGQANFIINALDVTAITSLAHFYTF